MSPSTPSAMMQSAIITAPKGAKRATVKTKKWTEASDDKYDKNNKIKENSSTDSKVDASRGLRSDLQSSLAKLRGGK